MTKEIKIKPQASGFYCNLCDVRDISCYLFSKRKNSWRREYRLGEQGYKVRKPCDFAARYWSEELE